MIRAPQLFGLLCCVYKSAQPKICWRCLKKDLLNAILSDENFKGERKRNERKRDNKGNEGMIKGFASVQK